MTKTVTMTVGRKKLSEEKLISINFKMPKELVIAINAKISKGQRSAFARQCLREGLNEK
jgi:hypothetical protein